MPTPASTITLRLFLLLFANTFAIYGYTQLILLDTIHTTENTVTNLSLAGMDRVVWYEGIDGNTEALQFYNNNLDTLFVDSTYAGCDSRGFIFSFENHVLWSIFDSSDPNCKHTFIWEQGVGIVEDQYGYFQTYYCQEENLVIVQQGLQEKLLDIENETLTSINLQNNEFIYDLSNICTLAGDIIWIKAGKLSIASGAYIGQAIVRYNMVSGDIQVIYESNDFLAFPQSDYPNRLAFTETLPENQTNIYYFGGDSVQFVRSGSSSKIITRDDGVIFKENGADSMMYWRSDGTTSLIHPYADLTDQSKCYYSYFAQDVSTHPFYNFQLFISDGVNTDSLVLNGLWQDFSLSDNNFVVLVYDEVTQLSHIIRGRHNLSCSGICPEDEIFVDSWNTGNFLNTKSIESIVNIGLPLDVQYEATDEILLSEGFHIPTGAEFTAKIVGCP